MMRTCFHELYRIGEINGTLIALNLKCDAPTSMSQFRPISLYNVI